MRTLFWLSVILSGIVTIVAFAMSYMLTPTFTHPTDNFMPINSLFILIMPFSSLVILYFLFAMMFVFERLHERFQLQRKTMIPLYVGYLAIVSAITVWRVLKLYNDIQPHFSYDIGYINAYSTSSIVNIWTFVALLAVAALCSFFLKKKSPSATHKKIQAVTK